MITLPTRTDVQRYRIEVELDAKSYVFDFSWNDRLAAWFFDVLDASDLTQILSGRRVVVGFPLWNRFRDPKLPAGVLEAIDTSDAGLDPLFAELGDRVLLVYTPAAEIPDELKIVV